jgi:hypothetical protein
VGRAAFPKPPVLVVVVDIPITSALNNNKGPSVHARLTVCLMFPNGPLIKR